MRPHLLAVVATAATVACLGESTPTTQPVGQVVLHVDTDAPVVSETPQAADLSAPIPLFDRIRFDVAGSASAPCSGCTQDFALTTEMLIAGDVSIGITPPPGDGAWTARVRVYALRFEQPDGEPDPGTAIDVTIALPSVDAYGIVDVSLVVSADATGQPLGRDTPQQPVLGTPAPSLVGSWSGASRTSCSGDPPAGMACVPGGAFWMGPPVDHLVQGTLGTWHRLVVLSAFFLDVAEVTSSAVPASLLASNGVLLWSGSSSGDDETDWCTGQSPPGARGPLPLNCVGQSVARAFCKDKGGNLPSEAQLEYVMGGLQMTPFVWGANLPACGDAVWGRNGAGYYRNVVPQGCLTYAVALRGLGGPERPGWGARDNLPVPGGPILDLTGNLAEWARDLYQTQGEPCWSQPGILMDPVCTTASPSLGAAATARGGAWNAGGTLLEASGRNMLQLQQLTTDLGFRCMKPAN